MRKDGWFGSRNWPLSIVESFYEGGSEGWRGRERGTRFLITTALETVRNKDTSHFDSQSLRSAVNGVVLDSFGSSVFIDM